MTLQHRVWVAQWPAGAAEEPNDETNREHTGREQWGTSGGEPLPDLDGSNGEQRIERNVVGPRRRAGGRGVEPERAATRRRHEQSDAAAPVPPQPGRGDDEHERGHRVHRLRRPAVSEQLTVERLHPSMMAARTTESRCCTV